MVGDYLSDALMKFVRLCSKVHLNEIVMFCVINVILWVYFHWKVVYDDRRLSDGHIDEIRSTLF